MKETVFKKGIQKIKRHTQFSIKLPSYKMTLHKKNNYIIPEQFYFKQSHCKDLFEKVQSMGRSELEKVQSIGE